MNIRDMASTLAAYNRWVNGQIYEAAAPFSEEERRRVLGGAFGSVHGTLSHLVVADQVWLQRFRGQPLTWPAPDQDVHPDFASLREARLATDADIESWVASLDPDFGDRPFSFRSIVYDRQLTLPGWAAVWHLFNHQTHHRGQVTTLLRQLGSTAPIFADLPRAPSFFA